MIKTFILVILLSLSLIFISYGAYLIWQRNIPLPSVSQTTTSDLSPVSISISDLNIHVAVYPGAINNFQWEYSTQGVSYLSSTPLPGKPGNSVFYGHNWPNILGPLIKAKPGMEIAVTFSNNTIKKFIISATATVSPSQIDIINPTNDIRLTIFTCTGFLDRDRFVVTAIPL